VALDDRETVLEGHKPKLPRVVTGFAVHTLPLAPLEGFVLSRIDAVATLSDIADLTSLDLEQVSAIVDKLIGLGAVEWADGTAHLPRMSMRSVAPPRPSSPSARSSQRIHAVAKEVPSTRPTNTAAAARAAISSFATPPRGTVRPPKSDMMPSDGIELAPDRRRRIDDLYVALDLLDHYEVLGVPRRAGKADVRKAYFELSKVFHPDTAFRKNVGAYRAKMEAIFRRLTEAYEVLGKKKSRDDYDAYLSSIGETRDGEHALSGEHDLSNLPLPTEAAAEAPAPEPPPPTRPADPPPAPVRSTPTEEGKRVARELLAKRFGAGRAKAPEPAAPPPPVEAPRTKQDAIRDLATTLKGVASQTGGVDRVSRLVAEARDAANRKDLAGAVRAYRMVLTLAPERADVAAEHERLARELAASLADRYEQQAVYEEKHQKWAAAAVSWAKVVEGRPDDRDALEHTALALLYAKGDLHRARSFAQRAVDANPERASCRLVLGRVFHAAGLLLNAKRELEAVVRTEPDNDVAKKLLSEIAART
jgi:hypothetical protein